MAGSDIIGLERANSATRGLIYYAVLTTVRYAMSREI